MRTINRRIAGVTCAVLLAMTAAACGGGGGTATTGGEDDAGQTVVTTEFEFEPASFSIEADADVTITVDNSKGMVEHDFSIDGQDDVEIFASPGEASSDTVNLPAGTYTYYCAVPGHRASGMEGELTVG